jgi:hypothetical protein
MKQKSFVLQNKGMNRDLSISKAGESAAYENRNIRILARDNDTLLSVTNERGTKEISIGEVGIGENEQIVGWNVLGRHILIFTHDTRYVPQEGEGGDTDPDPQYNTTTYKYRIVTTLDAVTVNATLGESVTAEATRQKKTFVNGVATTDWVYDSDVTALGFRATVGSEHVIISGNTISGVSAANVKISSRGYATEYVEADLEVIGEITPDTLRRYIAKAYAGMDEIGTSQNDEAAICTAELLEQVSSDGEHWSDVPSTPGNPNPRDISSYGFEFTDPSMSAYATLNGNDLKGVSPGVVYVQSSFPEGEAVHYEAAKVTVVQSSDSGGGSPDDPDTPGVPDIEYTFEAVWTGDNTVNYTLQIENLTHKQATYKNVTVEVRKTLSPSSMADSWLVKSELVGTYTVAADGATPLLTGTILFNDAEVREENYTYWVRWYDTVHHWIPFLQVEEEEGVPDDDEEMPSDTMNLLALRDEVIIPDRIYRIDYDGQNFRMIRGVYTDANGEGTDYEYDVPLFAGNLGFDVNQPIESIVYEETKDIKKIYWVDGIHVLRFMNFLEKGTVVNNVFTLPWDDDDTYFDSNRIADFGVHATVEKDNTGNTRANGVVQYLLTYFNKHGQETSYVWVSDLVYLSPLATGGSADDTNNNRVTLKLTGLDTSYTHFRVYSVFRSSLNGTTTAYLVYEGLCQNAVDVIDDGAHLAVQDSTRLLYLGSQAVVANTLTYKDQTLFLGDLRSIGRVNYDGLEAVIRSSMFELGTGQNPQFVDGETWESSCVTFEYSNDNTGDYSTVAVPGLEDIPYPNESGSYSYKSQLVYSSSHILTFKGGEKYRFGLKFKMQDGTETDAFWIGDKENDKYPVVDINGGVIKRVVAVCHIPAAVIAFLKDKTNGKFAAAQLLIAEATYADRSVKAQGIVNPTMFNVWERYNKRNYAIPTWISRPRGIALENRHFSPVHNSINTSGEIQCNYWSNTDSVPTPYFQYKDKNTNKTYVETFESAPTWNSLMLVFSVICNTTAFVYDTFTVNVRIVKAYLRSNDWGNDMRAFEFKSDNFTDTDWKYTPPTTGDGRNGEFVYDRIDEAGNILYTLKAQFASAVGGARLHEADAISATLTNLRDVLRNKYDIPSNIVEMSTANFSDMCLSVKRTGSGKERYFNKETDPDYGFSDALYAMNFYRQESGHSMASRWYNAEQYSVSALTGNKMPAYYKKHLMFVDENVVTLDSPEISYEAVSFDNVDLHFRIVGAAKLSSVLTDYTVDATPSGAPGTSLETEIFSGTIEGRKGNINGFTSWPLWKEYGLDLLSKYDNTDISLDERTSDHYKIGNNIVSYWLYLWQRSGSITGYNFSDEEDKKKVENASILHRKVIANLKYSYATTYLEEALDSANIVATEGVRLVTEHSGSYGISVASETEYYNGKVQMMLGMPGSMRYPIIFSSTRPDSTDEEIGADTLQAYLSSNAPVLLEYASGAHALISFSSTSTTSSYTQRILPYFFEPAASDLPTSTSSRTGALLPWAPEDGYDRDYAIQQAEIDPTPNHVAASGIMESDQYMFIGELYQDYGEGASDSRYGGITLSAVKNNRFINAGPIYPLSEMSTSAGGYIFGNQGDTYFQRWDDLRIKPFSNDSENNVIDIVSAMLETHINLDGRTDKQRGIPQLASIDTTTFGQLNPVYSQQNNFSVRRDMDADFNLDSYRSSITWTMQKNDMSDVDEWAHITLASSLKLDSDKGICRALRTFNNNIIAFQDKGISEVLFNSRTQLSTTDGVPVEIANSGKVDGKRYISNKYGCLNKWSIAEGKNGLYFVDSINKAFCRMSYGQYGRAAVEDLSTRLGFGNWFRTRNTINPWTPVGFNNFVSFYDRVHSDIYLLKKPFEAVEDEAPCLVYNELLGAFTSFYDYEEVPMLANVEDEFVSFKNNKLWLQNKGAYGDFFGTYKPFWVQYRVTPDPFGDKIWTNVEYRADFYKTLDGGNQMMFDSTFIDGQYAYQPNETFDFMRFWNEYQTTETDETKYSLSPIKKFRIWRQAIPRAMKSDTNRFGLDRIRNPWLNLLFKKNAPTATTSQDLMQLHDIIVTYYE